MASEDSLPGEGSLPPPEESTMREKVTYCVRDLLSKCKDRSARRAVFLEAFDIITRPLGHSNLELATAQCMIRAAIESGINHNHLTDGATTALAVMRFADEASPEGGIIVTS